MKHGRPPPDPSKNISFKHRFEKLWRDPWLYYRWGRWFFGLKMNFDRQTHIRHNCIPLSRRKGCFRKFLRFPAILSKFRGINVKFACNTTWKQHGAFYKTSEALYKVQNCCVFYAAYETFWKVLLSTLAIFSHKKLLNICFGSFTKFSM